MFSSELWNLFSTDLDLRQHFLDLRCKHLDKGKPPKPANSPAKPPIPKSIPRQYSNPAPVKANLAQVEDEPNDNASTQSDISDDSDEITPSVIASAMTARVNVTVSERALCHSNLVRCPGHSIAIVDSGADGTIFGDDGTFHIAGLTDRSATIIGFDDKKTVKGNCPMGTGITVMKDDNGTKFLAVFHEGIVNKGSNTTLISEFQVRSFGHICDTVAKTHRTTPTTMGTQQMVLQSDDDTYNVPLQLQGGLMTVPLCKPTPDELVTLPRVTMTSLGCPITIGPALLPRSPH